MCAKPRCGADVNATAHAQKMTKELIRLETRGTGDTENAMKRIANRYGLSWRLLWSLKYRPPHDLMCGAYAKLVQAYQTECRRQRERLDHEIEIARIKGVFVEDIAAEAKALVADEEGLK